MNMPSNFFDLVYLAACRANAAYSETEEKAKQAFDKLDKQMLGYFSNEDHQAVLSIGAYGEHYLSIAGTRFSDGKIEDLFDDLGLDLVEVGPSGSGCKGTKGAYQGLDDMWNWAKSLVPEGTAFTIEGHSLGAWRALYSPLFLPEEQIDSIYAFESPKGANQAYWDTYPMPYATHIVNGMDYFYGYPHLVPELTHPDLDTLWIQSTGYKIITPKQWPLGLCFSDHSMDLICSRLKVLSEN